MSATTVAPQKDDHLSFQFNGDGYYILPPTPNKVLGRISTENGIDFVVQLVINDCRWMSMGESQDGVLIFSPFNPRLTKFCKSFVETDGLNLCRFQGGFIHIVLADDQKPTAKNPVLGTAWFAATPKPV